METITQALDYCIDQARLERSANTVKTYRLATDVFRAYLSKNNIDCDKTSVADLPPALFIRFPGWLMENHTRHTAAVYMAGVVYVWKWLIIEGWLKPDYSESVRLEKAIEMARFNRGDNKPKTPVKGYAEKMIEAVVIMNEPEPRKARDIALVLFLSSSGCRNSEAVNLLIKDIDLDVRQAFIRNGKGDKDRNAYFSEESADAMRDYWKERGYQNPNDPVFTRHDKGAGKKKHKPITSSTVRNIINDVSALAGIAKGQFTPHSFRHSFAIRALDKTGNLALVQDLLGHASPQTTRIYAEIYEDDLRAAHHDIFG
jgi:site-specific recombinase XerD